MHYGNSDKGILDIKEVSESITVGNGKTMEATKIWNPRCDVEQVNGKEVVLQDLKYVRELWVSLFSIYKALKNGFKVGNDGIIIHLTKENAALSFNRI